MRPSTPPAPCARVGTAPRSARRKAAGTAAVLLALACLLAAPALATPPAALDPDAASRPGWVVRSFKGFAANWLRIAAREGGSEHRIGDGWEFEIRPTSSHAAPWVGILRYSEERWSCRAPGDCQLTDSGVVSEIFRFQDGRWVY